MDKIRHLLGLTIEWFNRNIKTILIGLGFLLIATLASLLVIWLRPDQITVNPLNTSVCDTIVSIGEKKICFTNDLWSDYERAKTELTNKLNNFLHCDLQRPDHALASDVNILHDEHFTSSTAILQVEAGQSDTSQLKGLSSGGGIKQMNQLGRIHCLGREYEIKLMNQSIIDPRSHEIRILYFEIRKR